MIKINLRQLLNERNITQAELAKAARIRPSTVSDLCNNVAERFKFSHLDAICSILNCDISDILKLLK